MRIILRITTYLLRKNLYLINYYLNQYVLFAILNIFTMSCFLFIVLLIMLIILFELILILKYYYNLSILILNHS
jgi:hypothetical protein